MFDPSHTSGRLLQGLIINVQLGNTEKGIAENAFDGTRLKVIDFLRDATTDCKFQRFN
jgi:hypothetical protein